MRRLPTILSFCLAMSAFALPAYANTIYVNPPTATSQHPIQDAIDSTGTFNGDTIVVESGLYRENIDFKGKNLIITSTLLTDPDAQQAAAKMTVIDGGFVAPAVSSTTVLSTAGFGLPMDFPGPTLSYFTIQNGGLPILPGGANAVDGGVYVTTTGDTEKQTLHIVGNIFISNQSGGVLIDGGLAYVYGNTFKQNICYGILVHAGGAGVIYNNSITDTQTPYVGCTYQQFYQPPTMTNSSAILVDGENSNNTEYARSLIVNNKIDSNTQMLIPQMDPILEGGAGIAIYTGSAWIESNEISNNTAVGGRGAAINIIAGASVEIDQNVIVNNQAGCGGGAIAFNPGGLNNLDLNPGNVFVARYSLLIANNTMVNNTSTVSADSHCGAAQQIQVNGIASPAVGFVNNIITGDTADAAIVCGPKPVGTIANEPVFDHNMFFNNSGPIFDSTCVDESMEPLFGNVLSQPTFVNGGFNPYELASGSAGIDAGNNGVLLSVATQEGFATYQFELYNYYYPETVMSPYINPAKPPFLGPEDKAGSLRFQDATGLVDQATKELDIIDMGAYEATGTSTSTGDGTVRMYMPPTGYTDMPGPSTLFADAIAGPNLDMIPSGTITFYMDGTQVGDPAPITPIPNPINPGTPAGAAQVPVNFTPGTHILTATYQPAPNQPTPKVPEAQSVAVVIDITSTPTKLKLAADPLSTDIGLPVTFTVTAPPAYAGYVPTPVSIFNTNNNNALIGTVMPDAKTGVGTLTTTNNLFLGKNDVQASFAGQGIYQPSVSNTIIITIGEPTTVKLTVSPTPTAQAYAPITFTADVTTGVTGVPTGSVVFYSAPNQPINATVVKNGVATLVAGLAAGTYSITAVYTGDSTFGVATSNAVAETVLPDSTTLGLSTSINPGPAFQPIPISATLATTVTVVPGSLVDNAINFYSDGVLIGTTITGPNGTATFDKSFPPGTYNLTASFAGTPSLNPSNSAAVSEVITGDSTAVTLSVTPNPGYINTTETLTAAVAVTSQSAAGAAGTLSGNVAFFDGTTMIGSSPVDATGHATFSTTAFTVGDHILTAAYGGGANYLPSTSAPVTLTILLRDFSLTADPSITIKTEGHKTLNATLMSLGSFSGGVSLTCGNLPQYVTCNFVNGGPQGSVQLAANATASVAIDVDTDALLNFASNVHPEAGRRGRGLIALALLLPVAFFARRRGGRMLRLFAVLFAFVAAASFIGCSGHQPGHTPPGTYNITVIAQGGGITHTANVTLIVTE